MHRGVVLASSNPHAAEKQGISLLVGQRRDLPKFPGRDVIGQSGRAQYAKVNMVLVKSRCRHN